MRTTLLSALSLVLIAAGCGGGAASTTLTPSNTQATTSTTPTSIEVTPATATVQILNGAAAAPVAFSAIGHYADGHTADLSSQVTWTLADATIGSMTAGSFAAATTRGGVTTLTAMSGSVTGAAQLEVDYVATRLSTDDGSTAPSNAAALFGAATADTTLAPGVLYPLDGVTVPANLGQLEIQWSKPATTTADLFEIALLGKGLDLRIYTNAPMTVGGRLSLQPAEWSAVSATLAGSTVQVQVTGMSSADPTRSGTGAPITATIDAQSLNGGIYYWTPSNQGIERVAFGSSTPVTNFYSATDTGGRCIACHALSRDGKKAAVSFDAGAGPSTVLDVATKTQLIALDPTINFNFASFSPDGNKLVGTNQNATPAGMLTIYDTSGGPNTGMILGQIAPAAGTYASHPDWSADGKSIVFSQAPAAAWATDFNFDQGSLVVVTDDGSGTFGNPRTLVASAGENNYYPSFSPDGKWVLFNRASGASYNNPSATAYVVATDGSSAPIALGNANSTGQLTDSWPRWSPFVQTYADGSTRMYFTFSSKRDYGIELQQPTDVSAQRPQIWMSAFSPAAALAGNDPSVAPFWLPFQDINTNNHIAQWTQTIVATVN